MSKKRSKQSSNDAEEYDDAYFEDLLKYSKKTKFTRVTTVDPDEFDEKVKQLQSLYGRDDNVVASTATSSSSRTSSSSSRATPSSSSSTTTANTNNNPPIFSEYGEPVSAESLMEIAENGRKNYRLLYQVTVRSLNTKSQVNREFVTAGSITFKNLNSLLCILFNFENNEKYSFSYDDKDGNEVQISKRASKGNLSASKTKFLSVCTLPGSTCTWTNETGGNLKFSLTVDVINTGGNLSIVPRCVGLLGSVDIDGKEGTLNETDTNIDRVNSRLRGKRFAANASSNKTSKQGISCYVTADTSNSELNAIDRNCRRGRLLTAPRF